MRQKTLHLIFTPHNKGMSHISTSVKSRELGKQLGAWVGREIQPKAVLLGLSWETLRRWIAGETFPRQLDLLGLAHFTGVPHTEWQRLLAIDLAARFPRRIDTVDQATAVVATLPPNSPVTKGQNRATANAADHVGHDTSVGAA